MTRRWEVEPVAIEMSPPAADGAALARAEFDVGAFDIGAVDVAAADAAALVARLAGTLAELAATVDGLGEGLAPTLAAAAAKEPALLVQAQALDAVSQSLHGLAGFLCRVGERRVGREPLHLEALAAALPLQALADRLSGVAAGDAERDPVFF